MIVIPWTALRAGQQTTPPEVAKAMNSKTVPPAQPQAPQESRITRFLNWGVPTKETKPPPQANSGGTPGWLTGITDAFITETVYLPQREATGAYTGEGSVFNNLQPPPLSVFGGGGIVRMNEYDYIAPPDLRASAQTATAGSYPPPDPPPSMDPHSAPMAPAFNTFTGDTFVPSAGGGGGGGGGSMINFKFDDPCTRAAMLASAVPFVL